jgi:putative component of membrane protein insertase Oxa1/YidC/SpoIIIJ protein YidD
MPHGGELFVPTYFATTPRVLFGTVAPEDLAVEPHCVRYAMRAAGEHKLAIRALAVAGRIGYCYPAADGRWALIVRNVFINPSGQYVDAPWGDPEDLGYAVQACNVHSALGRFSELEYHVPAIGPGTGQTECADVAQTWAFRGSREEITQIAATLIAAARCA